MKPISRLLSVSSTGRLIIEGLRQHQRNRLLLVKVLPVRLVELAEGRAGAVQHRFPPGFLAPALEMRAVDTFGLVVVKAVSDAAAIEPGTRLLHRVAVLDAVDRNRHAHAPASSSCIRETVRNHTI